LVKDVPSDDEGCGYLIYKLISYHKYNKLFGIYKKINPLIQKQN